MDGIILAAAARSRAASMPDAIDLMHRRRKRPPPPLPPDPLLNSTHPLCRRMACRPAVSHRRGLVLFTMAARASVVHDRSERYHVGESIRQRKAMPGRVHVGKASHEARQGVPQSPGQSDHRLCRALLTRPTSRRSRKKSPHHGRRGVSEGTRSPARERKCASATARMRAR